MTNASESDEGRNLACNIASRGVKRRERVAAAAAAFALGLAAVAPVLSLGASDAAWWALHAVVYVAFVTAFVAAAEARAKTCVVMGALGADLTQSLAVKRIADERRRANLALRSIGVLGAGVVAGTAVTALAAVAPVARLAFVEVAPGNTPLAVTLHF